MQTPLKSPLVLAGREGSKFIKHTKYVNRNNERPQHVKTFLHKAILQFIDKRFLEIKDE